jgi:thioredoxin reductase (NADPH)
MEEASFLTRFASKVAIVHRRAEFRASKIMFDRVKANPKIELMTPWHLDEITGTEAVEGVKLRHAKSGEVVTRSVAGVFLAIGHQPNTSIFKGHLELTSTGYVVTKPRSTYTSVEGVFACGDVQDHVYRQAITAAGSGCQAAIDSERWLEAQH